MRVYHSTNSSIASAGGRMLSAPTGRAGNRFHSSNRSIPQAGGSTASRPLQWGCAFIWVLSKIRGFGRLIAAPTGHVRLVGLLYFLPVFEWGRTGRVREVAYSYKVRSVTVRRHCRPGNLNTRTGAARRFRGLWDCRRSGGSTAPPAAR